MASPPPTPALHGTLAGISQQLRMSMSSVQGALKQGSSIAQLAQQQGVSRDALVQSIENQIQQTRQSAGQPPIDSSTLERLVNRAVDHHRRHRDVAGGVGAIAPSATDRTGFASALAGLAVGASPTTTPASTDSDSDSGSDSDARRSTGFSTLA
jgi:hypothetical protein